MLRAVHWKTRERSGLEVVHRGGKAGRVRRWNAREYSFSLRDEWVAQPLRGTYDIYGTEAVKFDYLSGSFKKIAKAYGFNKISTPIIENVALFSRSLGTDSDVVSKEMYVFEDKGKHNVVLRPENTAGVVRAFISNNMQSSVLSPKQFYYIGPMFRYERPQRGRFRQFYQMGVETIGDPHPYADISQISMAVDLLKEWNLLDRVTLEINTLGDQPTRDAFRKSLVHYLVKNRNLLSPLSLSRLTRGSPLRILDSKEPEDQQVIIDSPKVLDHLSPQSKEWWTSLLQGLDSLSISYKINPNLVRGLDYYDHTCYEFVTKTTDAKDEMSNVAVIGGGRYNRLISSLGGKEVPGVGWSLGVERVMELVGEGWPNTKQFKVAVIPIAENNAALEVNQNIQNAAFQLCQKLRHAKIATNYINNFDFGTPGKYYPLKKQLSQVNEDEYIIAIMIGQKEIDEQVANVKILNKREQSNVPIKDVTEHILKIAGRKSLLKRKK
eukprot:TRINITY_DN15678_c0_g1_i1.p1 TRINITY_DN15678_c0_g1~~TRINITY_DN15678_c0_g1_i1.p1  ORF type:complete len:515 (+),score=105.86 TRINITY_DN15678_c0_g1_i1:65-1546(+)